MKVIITDLDRTLLHTDKTLSEYTVHTLLACRQRGMKLVAATARPERSLTVYLAQLPFDALVTLNGARTVLPGRVIEHAIPRPTALRILHRLLAMPGALVSLEMPCGIYANRPIPLWNPTLFQTPDQLPEDAIYKLLVSFDQPELMHRVSDLLEGDVYSTIAAETLCQVMSQEATKWHGIQAVLDCYGLTPADAIYFGDDNDDLEPLARCGTGIAMANALPQVKEVADALTCSNDEDGVARYLAQSFL